MNVTFYGAAREVTGSMHLIDNGTDRILLDCGMFQGHRKESAEKNRVLPFDSGSITNLVLSHAHIDHSGRIPLLTKNNFHGRIYCTRATADACDYLLKDSARIQESDAAYLNYKTVRSLFSQLKNSSIGKKLSNHEIQKIKKMMKKGRRKLNEVAINDFIETYHLEGVEPLYTSFEAEQALSHFRGQPYRRPVTIGKNISCTFYDAGHIIGSAMCFIKAGDKSDRKTICFSGDIGRFDTPILKDPTLDFLEEDRNIDLLIMESTYGDRLHEPVGKLKPRLKEVINDTFNRGGAIIIPSFAFGRAQELIYYLHELYAEDEVPRLPIYVDSPLAVKLTRVYGEHPEVYDQETHEAFLTKGKSPFTFGQINFVESVEESMALNRDESPHIVISASGMCEAGRILHHLRFKIHNPKNTILIVGYMAAHTLGRRILDQGLAYETSGRKESPPVVKIFNKEYPLKARVVRMGGFSAHADKSELLRFITKSNLRIKNIAVVHGEKEQSLAFAHHLRNDGYAATVPQAGETIRL
jgi:metallo-beta-lactamase family protein